MRVKKNKVYVPYSADIDRLYQMLAKLLCDASELKIMNAKLSALLLCSIHDFQGEPGGEVIVRVKPVKEIAKVDEPNHFKSILSALEKELNNPFQVMHAKLDAILKRSIYDPDVPVERRLVEVEDGVYVKMNCIVRGHTNSTGL